MSKLELNDIKEQLKVQSETFTSQMQASHDNLMKAIQASSDNLNQSLGIKIATENQIIVSNLSHQMSEIKSRQDQESLARQDIETKVTGLQAQYGNVSDQLDRLATQPPVVDHAELARLLLPQVTADLSGQLKTHNHQAKATYFQSLVNEIKEHETGMMIYGFKPTVGTDLVTDIRTNLIENEMGLQIDQLKAVKVGVAKLNEAQPIRITFTNAETRNAVLGKGKKVPKGVRIEKCLPRKYRQKNKEFVDYGWQLKQVRDDVKTRTVFRGHLLVLEMKKLDQNEQKYDWIIMKEFYPEPEVPTDKGEVGRTRAGLTATKPLEEAEKNVVILSNLSINADKGPTETYFRNVYLTGGDDQKVIQVNTNKIDQKILIVTLTDRQACLDFAPKYRTIKFNNSEPRISVLLGGKD